METPVKHTIWIKLIVACCVGILIGLWITIFFPFKTHNKEAKLTDHVKLYYVAVGDNGKIGKQIGCEDSLVPVITPITPTKAPLKAALETLFANKKQFSSSTGLTNSLYQSNLVVDYASVATGTALVMLSGKVQLGGVCDDPRFVYQIKSTVLQFPTINEAFIYLNKQPLETYFSEKY